MNRPFGRVLAAAAYIFGLSPNQVTYLSAAFTFGGIGILAIAPASWPVGIAIALCLLLGYALDSADGQLARLRGGGSLHGEWLDHTIDSIKVVVLHLAVLISLYRNFELRPIWLLVPIVFAVTSSVHFFGIVLVDLLGRIRRDEVPETPVPGVRVQLLPSLLRTPMDYGTFCLVFLLLGWHPVFLGAYTVLAVANTAYSMLVFGKWRRDVMALDAPVRA